MSRTFHLIMYAMLIGYAAFMTWMTDEYEGIVDQQQDTLEAVLYSQGCLQPVQPDEA